MNDCYCCPVEEQCGYEYKPCDCVHQRKFVQKETNVNKHEALATAAISPQPKSCAGPNCQSSSQGFYETPHSPECIAKHNAEYAGQITPCLVTKYVTEMVQSYIGNADEFSIDSTFKNLGLDSIDEVEMVMQLEEKFSIEIPDDDLGKGTNTQDVVNYVKQAVSYIL